MGVILDRTRGARSGSIHLLLAGWAAEVGRWCLFGLVVTLPFWRHRVLVHRPDEAVFFEWHDVIFYTNDVLWAGLLGWWLLSRVLAWGHSRVPRLRIGPLPLACGLVALVAASVASLPAAVDQRHTAYLLLRLLMLLGLYLAVLDLRPSPRFIAAATGAGILLQAILALPQFLLGHWVGLRRLGEIPFDPAWSGTAVVMIDGRRWPRAYGRTQHPNVLGGCMMFFLLVLTAYVLRPSERYDRGWLRVARGALVVVLALGLATLLVSYSRSAWLGTAVGAAIGAGVIWSGRKAGHVDRRMVLALGIALAITAAGFIVTNRSGLAGRIGISAQGTEIRSVEERRTLTDGALALIAQRPLWGVGLGNFSTALYRLAPEAVADYPVYQPVHNVLLLATAELGPAGGIAWLWLLLAPWVVLWRGRSRLPTVPNLAIKMAGLAGALAALATVSWFDHYIWSSHQGQLMQWLTWGLWAGAWTGGDSYRGAENGP